MADRVEFDAEERVAYTTRSIGKSGNSLVVRIPPQILEVANLEQGDSVQLVADMDDETITIRHLTAEEE
jgi:antitoxin component of MazEF toxin-antitoxin module